MTLGIALATDDRRQVAGAITAVGMPSFRTLRGNPWVMGDHSHAPRGRLLRPSLRSRWHGP